MPHRRIWNILLHDRVALTEVLSGLFLVSLRGVVLLGTPRLFSDVSEVARTLREIHVTEERWGTYLMLCGLAQIFLARTPYTARRAVVTTLILLGFVVMGAGYYFTYHDWEAVPPSVICMSAFYTFLLTRVGLDYRRARRRAFPAGD